ncbi:MAG: hypothetical protein K2H16_09575 [Prevotella sp.]|nr:hypothetical protein [Prevotella sp.]
MKKPVWQQTDPAGEHYLNGRRALAGDGCEVNMLVSTVDVGAWANDLDNLVDEDLSNTASFPGGVSVGVGVAPVVSIRDMKNHYSAGTTAGFVIASAEGSLLSLDVIKAYAIQFYRDGEKIGDPIPVTEGQNAGALSLSLIKIPGSKDVTTTLSVEAPEEFDEVCLMPAGGVKLELIANTRVKYAFVGKAKQYNLVNSAEGIQAFNKDFGKDLVLEAESSDIANTKELIDEDLENGVNFVSVGVGGGHATVKAMPRNYNPESSNNEAPFKAGTVFGFHYANATDVLNIGGKTIKLYLGKKIIGKKEEDIWGDGITVSGDILKVSLTGGNSGDIEIRVNQDCYGAELQQGSVGIGGMKIQYAYVRTPDAVSHRCDMRLSADAHICDTETTYKVTKAADIDVTYAITSQPEGANAVIDSEGNITGMTVNGDYVVTATSVKDCHCTETLTIHRGMDDIDMTIDDKPLYNVSDEVYMLSTNTHGVSGALINIDDLSDPSNILNAQTGAYAQDTGGLGLAENIMITGVRTKDGNAIKDMMPGKKLKRVGFMVETRSEGLGLDALKFFCIRGFKNGQEVFNKPVEESNAVSLGLIGSSKAEKMRYSVIVPDDAEDIDEFQLWKEGVLNLTISKLNIFYAFAAEEDNPATPLAGVKVVSVETGASLNIERMKNVNVLSVANVTHPLTNLIDNDLETPLTLAKTVSAGGAIYAVNLGHTYRKHTQVGFVIDNKTYTASVGVGKWMKMTTYLNGGKQEEQQDWNVLGVSVIGAGDKRLIIMNTEKDFDEVGIEFSGVLDALDFIKIYGVFVRDDTDGDGVPDNMDENSCQEDLILNEEITDEMRKEKDYDKARLLLHRTFNRGENIGDNLWSSIVLPVSLTGLQVRNAFGNDTRLAEVRGMEGDMLVFQKIDVPANDDGPVIKAGSFYIIETIRKPDYTKTAGDGWDAFSDGTPYNSGDIYYIDGVSYSRENEDEPSEEYSNSTATHKVQFFGTYNYDQQIPANIYAFSGGKLWNITNSAKMKGFRFWIEETFGGSSLKHMPFKVIAGDGGTTYISGTAVDKMPSQSMVYDTAGHCIGTTGKLFDLPNGIYIVNGKRILIK